MPFCSAAPGAVQVTLIIVELMLCLEHSLVQHLGLTNRNQVLASTFALSNLLIIRITIKIITITITIINKYNYTNNNKNNKENDNDNNTIPLHTKKHCTLVCQITSDLTRNERVILFSQFLKGNQAYT